MIGLITNSKLFLMKSYTPKYPRPFFEFLQNLLYIEQKASILISFINTIIVEIQTRHISVHMEKENTTKPLMN